MRSVRKANPGDKVHVWDGTVETVRARYENYGDAKACLLGCLDSYCSYCESPRPLVSDSAVEHILYKDKYKEEEHLWENYLLTCTNCNSCKLKKDVGLNPCHLPHLNNTFLSLKYDLGGVVKVNPDLEGESRIRAERLWRMVGLDKGPKDSSDKDSRWMERMETWNIAEEKLARYRDSVLAIPDLMTLVRKCGHWSIWFTVFAGEDEVLSRLISDFKGTAVDCFDPSDHYRPLPRNPQNAEDPV